MTRIAFSRSVVRQAIGGLVLSTLVADPAALSAKGTVIRNPLDTVTVTCTGGRKAHVHTVKSKDGSTKTLVVCK